MRSPNPASGSCASALAINALTHAPVTLLLPLYGIGTAPWLLVQKNSTSSRRGQRAIRRARKILVADSGWPRRPPPAACGPSPSEQKDGLERRKNRLQLRCNLHGLKFLQLLRVEDGEELREKSLLRLRHLLLQSVNLDHQCAHLRGVPAGIQQIAQLVDQDLRRLKERHERCLARLQQLLQLAHLARLQLQKLSHNLQRRSFLSAGLNPCCLHLLEHFFDV